MWMGGEGGEGMGGWVDEGFVSWGRFFSGWLKSELKQIRISIGVPD